MLEFFKFATSGFWTFVGVMWLSALLGGIALKAFALFLNFIHKFFNPFES